MHSFCKVALVQKSHNFRDLRGLPATLKHSIGKSFTFGAFDCVTAVSRRPGSGPKVWDIGWRHCDILIEHGPHPKVGSIADTGEFVSVRVDLYQRFDIAM